MMNECNDKAWIYNLFKLWMGEGLVTSGGQKAKYRRKLLNPSFRSCILNDFLPIFNEKSMKLVKILGQETGNAHSDLLPHLQLCSLDIICATTLGVDIEAQEKNGSEFAQSTTRVKGHAISRLFNPINWLDILFTLNPSNKVVVQDLKVMKNLTRLIIEKKKEKLMKNKETVGDARFKKNSVMEVLLKHHLETKELTDEDILDEVNTFIVAGFETVSQASCWTLYLIGLHKDVQTKIHKEMDEIFGDDVTRPVTKEDLNELKYLERVIKESMRIYPSVSVFARGAGKDTKICGCSIPDGAMVIVFAYQLNRNEKYFPNPEKFDPDRFMPENCKNRNPYVYVPFSIGMRNCIGQKFAMMEEKVMLANILRNYSVQSLDQRDTIRLALEMTLKPETPLRIKLKQRKNNK